MRRRSGLAGRPGLALLCAALFGEANAEDTEAAWYAMLVAERLHPVRERLLVRWQHRMAGAMAGPGASPWFRDTASALDVRWRLEAGGFEPLEPAAEEVARARDLAFTGAALGLHATLREVLGRSERMRTVYQVAQALSSPMLGVEQHGSRLRVKVGNGMAAPGPRRASAAEPPRNGGRAAPAARLGAGFGLVSGGDPDRHLLEEAPVPAATAWMELSRIGVDALRLDAIAVQPWAEGQDAASSLQWSAVARKELLPGLYAVAELYGAGEPAAPARLRAGLVRALPGAWTVRPGLTLRFPAEDVPEGEWRAELFLRTNLGWVLPQDPRRWPLGLEPGAEGPPPPALEDANTLVPLVRPPAWEGLVAEGPTDRERRPPR